MIYKSGLKDKEDIMLDKSNYLIIKDNIFTD